MNAQAYVAGKATGKSGIAKHGVSTFLIKWPGGEQGFQRMDIEAYRASALNALEDAPSGAMAEAADRLAEWDELLDDIDAL